MNSITNEEFLKALFPKSENAWVASFESPTHPNWTALKRPIADLNISATHNNYFCPSQLNSTAVRRLRGEFKELPLIVIDDPKNIHIFPDPTYLIQTSRDKYQIGFALKNPIKDIKEAESFMGILTGSTTSDTSGNNPVRWVRLPQAINNKPEHGEPFACQLVEWNPDLLFDSQELKATLIQILGGGGIVLNPPTATGNSSKGYTNEELFHQIAMGDVFHQSSVALIARYYCSSHFTKKQAIEEIESYFNKAPQANPTHPEHLWWKTRKSELNGLWEKKVKDPKFQRLPQQIRAKDDFAEEGPLVVFTDSENKQFAKMEAIVYDKNYEEEIQKKNLINILKGLNNMKVTNEIAKKIGEEKFVFRHLFPHAQSTILVGEGNAGKTTFMVYVAAQMAKEGFQVLYVNADASASQLKDYYHHAEDNNYSLINPDLTNGSTETVVAELINISKSEHDLSNVVIILDTLKKFVDLMSKTQARNFFKILRALTAKSVTVISLAHSNKYKDTDGLPIYEGTADVRNDNDNLIYLVGIKNEDGTKTVSTKKDKERAAIEDVSFTINRDREILMLKNFVDTSKVNRDKLNIEKDQEVIAFISSNIKVIPKSITALNSLANKAFSRRVIERVCKQYADTNTEGYPVFWDMQKAPDYGFVFGNPSKIPQIS
jgi:hypothetical protein